MIGFNLTEEQLALRTLVREFVEREVKPVALERDQRPDPRDCFPWDIVEKASAAGLRTLSLAKKYGGGGQDSLTLAMCVEELAAGDLGVSVIFAQTWKWVQIIQEGANEEQQQRFLIPFRDDPRYLMALGWTEPDGGGSDNILPYLDPKGGMKLSAVRDGDHVILNGMKHFISNGGVSKLYIIFARTDKNKPVTEGTTAFLVPSDTPGFSIGQVHNKIGERLVNNSELIFENCRVPMKNMMWEWNGGFRNVPKLSRQSNAYAGASALGVGRAAFEKALDWAKTRVQGGKPIIEHTNIAIALGEMWSQIEAARLLIWKAAWAADRPEHFDPKLARVPKIIASEVAMRTALRALEIHGGYGVMKEVGMEKLVRDASVFLHSDGLNDILKLVVGNILKQED